MAELIFLITEFYTSNSDDFAHRISGSQVLFWFSPLTYFTVFTHTLTSCAQAVCARQVFKVRLQQRFVSSWQPPYPSFTENTVSHIFI